MYKKFTHQQIAEAAHELNVSWLRLPVIKMNDASVWFSKHYKGGRVLDVGGADRKLKRMARIPDKMYELLDIDPVVKPDHTSWKTVQGKFDYIVMFAIVEHLKSDVFAEYLEHIRKHLKEDGRLIITVPNIYNLQVFQYDHITFYTPYTLYGFVRMAGFKPKVYRCRSIPRNPLVKLIHFLRRPFTYFFEIDFNCLNLMVVAKPNGK